MIIPHQNIDFIFLSRCDGTNIGISCHSGLQHFIYGHGTRTAHRQAHSAEHSKHTECIHDWLVESICRQFTKPSEIRLVFKLKSPGHSALKMHAPLRFESIDLIQTRRAVRRVKRSVSIRIFRMLLSRASGATFGIRFAKNDRRILPLRKRSNDIETALDGSKMIADAHAHMSILKKRMSLGMKTDEVQWGPVFARGKIFLVGTMIEKC